MPFPSMFVTHVNGSTDIRDIDKIRTKLALLAWGSHYAVAIEPYTNGVVLSVRSWFLKYWQESEIILPKEANIIIISIYFVI